MCRCVQTVSLQLLDIGCKMLTSCLCIVIITEGIRALRMSKLELPGVVIKGEPVWLNCSYEIETDDLYSIKWYKNNLEFYRYLPSDDPPAQKYNLLGIYLDLVKSELGHLYLYKTDMNSEGKYRCEVSADAPSFQTVRGEKEMRIYVLPEHDPVISGAQSHYRIGDEVNVTCAAAFSKPAAMLKWHVNDNDAPREYEIHYTPITHVTGLESSRLGLKFRTEPFHFLNGTMKLKCVALLSQVYGKSSEEIVASSNARSAGLRSAIRNEAVIITGGKPRYHVGEYVDVNCTSVKSQPPAELRWYINEKKVKSNYVIYYPSLRYPDGRESALLGLRFMVRPRHFKQGEMRLKCTATLSTVFNISSKEMVLGSGQQIPDFHILPTNGRASNHDPIFRIVLRVLLLAILLSCL